MRRTCFLFAFAAALSAIRTTKGQDTLFTDAFSPPSSLWGNERGNWTGGSGVYDSQLPSNNPTTLTTLPFHLTDFTFDVTMNQVADGGVWLRTDATGSNAVLLVIGGEGWGGGSRGPNAGRSLYWHVVHNNSYSGILNEITQVIANPGVDSDVVHVTVSGDTYSATVNGKTITLIDSSITDGRVGLYDFYGPQNFSSPVLVGINSTVVPGETVRNSDGVTTALLQVNGSLLINANSTPYGSSKVSTLTIGGSTGAWTGRLDLANNTLIVQPESNKAAALAALMDQITTGAVSGKGLTSTSVSADPAHKTLVAVDNALVGLTRLGGLNADADSLLVEATWFGDSNLDRKVDVTDLGTLATHYGQTSVNGVLEGDFNQDGKIDVTDLGLLATNYGQGTSGGAFTIAVPEPSSIGTMLLTACLLARRRGAVS